MSDWRSDRFIFGSKQENNGNFDYWRRSLQLSALRNQTGQNISAGDENTSTNSRSAQNGRQSYGIEYQEALEQALDPLKLSFSLKPRRKVVDKAKLQLDKYIAGRRGEIDLEPVSVLDAPGLRDDYYLNVLDWSSQDMLAVALNERAYIWDPKREQVRLVSQVNTCFDYISSLVFSSDGNTLVLANSQGCLSSIDVCSNAPVRDFTVNENGRVAVMAMCPAGASIPDDCLTVGSRSGNILHFDPRQSGRLPVLMLKEHTLEVCGLRRSYDSMLIASGGNDNKVCIWDLRWPSEPRWIQDDHMAAVKALDWCPWQPSLLATGSGTADRRIRFWNTSSNTCLRQIQCESQVCGLRWSTAGHHSEIVSTHGFSNNELAVWHYPSLSKVVGMRAHETRVLQAALSADGSTLVTAAANEHLKFWNIFPCK